MEKVKLKLSQFLNVIKSQFDDIIGYHSYIIEAEIKSIKKYRQFYYIDLVEIENGKIINSTRSNIFNPSVMTSFLRDVKIVDIQELVGKKLLLEVKPTFHKTYNFSVNILKIYSDFFVGGLEKKKKNDIEELKLRGIFYDNKSKKIGYPTFNIAIITGNKSEGYRDFETILKESGYKYKITVFNSLVHGEKASKEVLGQLLKIKNGLDNGELFNLVAIIRGGGGSEGMNWSNDLDLCNAVCEFPIPVMTAVGHTVDQSILDMISCYDCKTPSEASQILIDIYDELYENISSDFDYINNNILDLSNRYKIELKFISKNLPLQISNRIRFYKQQLVSFNIDKKIIFQSKLLLNKLNIIYTNISSNNPDKVLKKGYSLVSDKSGNSVQEFIVGNEYIMKNSKGEYVIEVKSEVE